ncbi:hypothetical protein [Nostoc sp. NIES-3756]|nr:hypothetical protein [Nostoc sp. NIES-3756]
MSLNLELEARFQRCYKNTNSDRLHLMNLAQVRTSIKKKFST